jgi:hypothetical protein
VKKLVSRKGQGGSRAKVAEEVAKPDFSAFYAKTLRSLREKNKLHAKVAEEVAKLDFSAFSARNFALSV